MSKVTKIVGIGGGGCNILDYMIKQGMEDFETIPADVRIDIGKSFDSDEAFGVGTKDPEIGAEFAKTHTWEIFKTLNEATSIVLVSCLGGGTGSGSTPVIASIAKRLDVPVYAVVTTPFRHEGAARIKNAEDIIVALKDIVDRIVVHSNEEMYDLPGDNIINVAFDKFSAIILEDVCNFANQNADEM